MSELDGWLIVALVLAYALGLYTATMIEEVPIFWRKNVPGKHHMVTDSPNAPDRYLPMFGAPITDWYRTFAWKPVWTIDRDWVWLRPVWRRRISLHPHLPGPKLWNQTAVRK